jgi:hypothetical protein
MGLSTILIKGEYGKMTTKELQSTLKVALNKVSIQDFILSLGTVDCLL